MGRRVDGRGAARDQEPGRPGQGRSPGDAGVQLELRVRRRIRNSFETRRAYEEEKRSYELAIRQRDQAFERLLAPPVGVIRSSRSPLLEGLIEQVTQVVKAEDRLAALWTSFRTERLALYRDLGVLPYNDWHSFYADLSAGPVAAPAVPAVLPKPGAAGDAPGRRRRLLHRDRKPGYVMSAPSGAQNTSPSPSTKPGRTPRR